MGERSCLPGSAGGASHASACKPAGIVAGSRAGMLASVEEDAFAGQIALVTGGGRGIGADIARELARAGMRVAVAARSGGEIEEVAREIGGMAVQVDVSQEASVARMVAEVSRELGPIEVLVNDAGAMSPPDTPPIWEESPSDWWRIFEVNMLGAYLCCRAVLPGMIGRREGRIVNVGSGAAYLPVTPSNVSGTAYGPSKAALYRFGELLAGQLAAHGVAVFTISPGLVRTAMTDSLGDAAPWTPPECAPRLVRVLASGRADALSGRYLHAEHDDIEDLIRRADEIAEGDLNAIRLTR
jgi:3-oxoacyl-[acyl-carrier protein] reductase